MRTVDPKRTYRFRCFPSNLGRKTEVRHVGNVKQPIQDWRRFFPSHFPGELDIAAALESFEQGQRLRGLCHVNLNWPREVSTTQFEFMRLSQLATSGKLLLGRRGACGGM